MVFPRWGETSFDNKKLSNQIVKLWYVIENDQIPRWGETSFDICDQKWSNQAIRTPLKILFIHHLIEDVYGKNM